MEEDRKNESETRAGQLITEPTTWVLGSIISRQAGQSRCEN